MRDGFAQPLSDNVIQLNGLAAATAGIFDVHMVAALNSNRLALLAGQIKPESHVLCNEASAIALS